MLRTLGIVRTNIVTTLLDDNCGEDIVNYVQEILNINAYQQVIPAIHAASL